MVAMPPDPAAVSARTLRERCLPGRCGPRAAPIHGDPGCSCLEQARKLGEKPRQALRKRKTKAPCEGMPPRARIHGATWFHRPCRPGISPLLCPEPLRGGASPPSRSICDVAGLYDFPPHRDGTAVACDSTLASRMSCHHVMPGDSNCTCVECTVLMYSYAPLPRSFKVFAAV